MYLLLVEDNPGDADLVRDFLGSAGGLYDRIDWVQRLERAKTAFEDDSPDVVLLDLNLPDASPDETIRAVEKLSKSAAVIVLTGQAQEDLELRALKAGADEFLEKELLDEALLRRCLDHAVERYNMRASLRQRERQLEKYRIIVEHSTEAVRMKDGEGRFQLVNERFEELVGRSESELIGRSTSDVYGEEFADLVKERERDVRESGEIRTDEEQGSAEVDDHTMLTTRIPYDVDGELTGTIAIGRDITDQKKKRKHLEKQALFDPMTGLPNRSLFRKRLRQTIKRSRTRGTSFALGFLDVDDFKEVNDSLGHRAGDTLIESIADRLSNQIRRDDTVARVGGDEFTMIFQSVDNAEHLESVGQRLREAFDNPFEIDGSSVYVSVSVGFSLPDLETLLEKPFEESFESMTRSADRAMYRAKERSGSSWRLAGAHAQTGSSRHIHQENRIRESLEQGSFEPYFQPVVNVADRSVVACEMLARWDDPKCGMVSPAEFIPIVENSTLIDDISETLLEQACQAFSELGTGTDSLEEMALYVHLSADQLARPAIFERFEAITEAELPPEIEVAFEVTETALLRHTESAERLRERGFSLLIDDFGTGHLSLSRLKEMPVDGLKLDMEFVHGIGEEAADEAIVETVVALGARLDLRVVAEGVETREQYEYLREVGCSAAQGFLFGRPAPLARLAED